MLHAFVDESESKTDYYFLSALILDDQGLSQLTDVVDAGRLRVWP